MSKVLRQLTNYLEQKQFTPEFDIDSHTLFLNTSTAIGDFQTRFFFDLDMEVLSCQCIYLESFPHDRYEPLCELVNRFNEQLGFGAFVILDKEDIVFEINYLMEASQQLPLSIIDKLTMVPAEALIEHIDAFRWVALEGYSAEKAFLEMFGE